MLQTEVRRPRPEVDALLRRSSKTGLASNFKATSALGKKVQGIKVINFNPDIAICRVFTPSAKVNQRGPPTNSRRANFKKRKIATWGGRKKKPHYCFYFFFLSFGGFLKFQGP